MKIPKAFSFKGKTWRVKIVKDLGERENDPAEGICDFEKKVIYLDAGLKGKKLLSVFYHELTHVMIHEAHVNPGVRFSAGLEEILCDAVSDMLLTNFSHMRWINKQ